MIGLGLIFLANISVSPPIPPVVIAPAVRPAGGITPLQAIRRGVVRLTPQEAVMKAADAFPAPVIGVVEFTVRRAEQVGPNFFLNSEPDYRDPRNISVRIMPPAQPEMRARWGNDLSRLIGQRLWVLGPSIRTRIDLIDSAGRLTGKYYYQTHELVREANQVQLAP